MFTEMTPPPGGTGGLLNAIVGSLILTVLAVLFGTPLGILAGTYMAEYGRYAKLTMVVRFINDILLSAPSIVVGLFVYEIMVAQMGHFSAWAGAVALAMIVIPVVVRTTEDMLLLVPNTLREASSALGLPRWIVIRDVAYRAARAGMITGVLLAVARITGETAPLLFTALNNQFFSWNFNAPMASLPVVIFQFALSPYEDWQQLAWMKPSKAVIISSRLSIACGFSILAMTGSRDALLAHDLADVLDVRGRAHEGQRDEVDGRSAAPSAGPRCPSPTAPGTRHGDAGQVDALVVADLAADHDAWCATSVPSTAVDAQPDLAVVDQDRVARVHVAGQALVRRRRRSSASPGDVAGGDRRTAGPSSA